MPDCPHAERANASDPRRHCDHWEDENRDALSHSSGNDYAKGDASPQKM